MPTFPDITQQYPSIPSTIRIKHKEWLPTASTHTTLQRTFADLDNTSTSMKTAITKKFKNKKQYTNKINQYILKQYKQIKQQQDYLIVKADKNLGLCLCTPLRYHTLCLDALKEPDYKIDNTVNINNKIFAKLRGLLAQHNMLNKTITNKNKTTTSVLTDLAKALLQLQLTDQVRTPQFYGLFKMHKTPISIRPICSSINSPTYLVSKYLDSILQPVRRLYEQVCINSASVIAALEHVHIPPQHVIVVADVRSLYPTIPIDFGIAAVRHELQFQVARGALSYSTAQISLVLELLAFTLNNNYVQYDNQIYHQQNGTAMGTPVAVAYADIVLAHLERHMIITCKPLFYRRYIDDLLLICHELYQPLVEPSFNAVHSAIQLDPSSVKHGSCGVHLDVEYKIVNNHIESQLYQKPINKYLYIPPLSNHHPTMIRNLIVNELRRYRLADTQDTVFQEHTQQLYQRLLNRGYKSSTILQHFKHLPDRNKIIQSVKPTSKQHNRAPFLITLDRPSNEFVVNWHDILKSVETIAADPILNPAYNSIDRLRLIIGFRYPKAASFYLINHGFQYTEWQSVVQKKAFDATSVLLRPDSSPKSPGLYTIGVKRKDFSDSLPDSGPTAKTARYTHSRKRAHTTQPDQHSTVNSSLPTPKRVRLASLCPINGATPPTEMSEEDFLFAYFTMIMPDK